jgi:hypothetical protein
MAHGIESKANPVSSVVRFRACASPYLSLLLARKEFRLKPLDEQLSL